MIEDTPLIRLWILFKCPQLSNLGLPQGSDHIDVLQLYIVSEQLLMLLECFLHGCSTRFLCQPQVLLWYPKCLCLKS